MASKNSICNLALSNIGISQFVTTIATEQSNEAVVCRQWYDICVEAALRDFDWNFARKRQTLALLTQDPPEGEWDFVYALPAECLAARRLAVPGNRNPTRAQRIPFEIAIGMDSDVDTEVLYTDLEDAVLIYTRRIVDPTLFDAQFVVALSYFLAAHIAMPLSVAPKLADQAQVYYQRSKSSARKSDFNEGTPDQEPDSETAAARA